MHNLHLNMRVNRKQLCLTQQAVAEMLNVDRSTYTAYETKRVPSLDVLIKLSRLYRITLDELVGVVRFGDTITIEEPQTPLMDFDNADLKVFDKYLTQDERNLLFSIRVLNDDQIQEVKDLIQKYVVENSPNSENE